MLTLWLSIAVSVTMPTRFMPLKLLSTVKGLNENKYDPCHVMQDRKPLLCGSENSSAFGAAFQLGLHSRCGTGTGSTPLAVGGTLIFVAMLPAGIVAMVSATDIQRVTKWNWLFSLPCEGTFEF